MILTRFLKRVNMENPSKKESSSMGKTNEKLLIVILKFDDFLMHKLLAFLCQWI